MLENLLTRSFNRIRIDFKDAFDLNWFPTVIPFSVSADIILKETPLIRDLKTSIILILFNKHKNSTFPFVLGELK